MMTMIVRGADVLQCFDGSCRVLERHDILISGNRIADVRPTGPVDDRPGIQVVDGKGMLAIPGLINTHSHVAMAIFRGLAEDVDIETWFNEYMWPLEANLTADDVEWGVQSTSSSRSDSWRWWRSTRPATRASCRSPKL